MGRTPLFLTLVQFCEQASEYTAIDFVTNAIKSSEIVLVPAATMRRESINRDLSNLPAAVCGSAPARRGAVLRSNSVDMTSRRNRNT
jgi:hypothetical protein